jgi:putative ABC transport system permease protein
VKHLKYVLRNATRNKLRSMLTVLSVAICLALLTVLIGYLAMQDAWADEAARHNRIVVMNVQGFAGLLPISYVDRVRSMPGVIAAVPFSWFGGVYKEEKMTFAQFATDPKELFKVWPEYTIDPKQLEAFLADPQAAVVDRRTAERRGWKIGEKIPLQGNIYPVDLELVLVGTYDSPAATDSLFFHWNFLEESLKQKMARGQGNAGTIFVKCTSGTTIPQLIRDIDDRFANSDNPTRTQTEAAFAQMFAEMMGHLKLYITVIGIAVVFALTLAAANAMAMSMRERTTEVAVLKAIGFPTGNVVGMLLGESCVVCLAGGALGLGLGSLMLSGLHAMSPQFFPLELHSLVGPWMGIVVAAAGFIGIASGLVPAARAAQLSVIDGLRRVV